MLRFRRHALCSQFPNRIKLNTTSSTTITMKFATFFTLSVVVASASASSLRASSSRPSEFAAASVSIVGLTNAPTAEDLEVVAESVKAAYNELFASPSAQALDFEIKSGAVVASEVSQLTRYVCRGTGCFAACEPTLLTKVWPNNTLAAPSVCRMMTACWRPRMSSPP